MYFASKFVNSLKSSPVFLRYSSFPTSSSILSPIFFHALLSSGMTFSPSSVILVKEFFPDFSLSTYPFETNLSTNLVTVDGAIAKASDI